MIRVAKAVLTPLLLLLVGLLAALVLAEITARTFFAAARDQALPRSLVTLDDDLGWRLAKGVRVTHATTDFEVDYAVNSLGFRGDEPGTEPDPQRLRIALYGDSQVFGWGVPAEQRFSAGIESRLDSVAVWNLAVPGYGVDQQALAYERDGDDFEAGATLLFFSPATMHRIHYDYLYGIYKPSFRLRDGPELHLEPPRGRPTRDWLFRLPGGLYFPYMLDQAASRIELQRGTGRLTAAETGPTDRLMQEILRRTQHHARARQHRLMVLAELTAADRLRQTCRELGVDLLTIRLPEERAALTISEQDPHWNVAAHRQIADQLAPQLAAVVDRD